MKIIRGPNIAALPRFEVLPDELEGELLLALGDNVTTDDILPTGAHILAKRANISAIAKHIFSNIDPEFENELKPSTQDLFWAARTTDRVPAGSMPPSLHGIWASGLSLLSPTHGYIRPT